MERSFEERVALFPPELTRMIGLLQEKADRVDWESVDAGQFVALCLHHRVFPAVHAALKTIDAPAAIREPLQAHYQRAAFRMFRLAGLMDTIASALAERQIRALFLKGPVLAAELYGDITRRCSGDIDLLVPIQELERTDQVLRTLGYEREDYFESVLNDWRWRHHHVNYVHGETNIKVEVHWRLHPGPGPEPGFEVLWKRSRPIVLANAPIRMLGKEDLVVFLAVHGARHGWSRLRWLADIDRLCRQDVDWAAVRRTARKCGALHIVQQALYLSAGLFGTDISAALPGRPSARPQRLAVEALFYIENRINLHTDPVPEAVSRYHRRHLYRLMPLRQKILYWLSMAYPFAEDANALPLPKPLHFLYFPLRPLLWAWRRAARPAR